MHSLRRQYRPMRRREYQEAVEELKRLHPWLEKQVFQPAPGHLAVVAELITQCERLMHRSDYQRRPLFCVTATRKSWQSESRSPMPASSASAPCSTWWNRLGTRPSSAALFAVLRFSVATPMPPKALGALRTSKW